ncbi:hypothetical protein DY218_18600 [Streptomyces triticagri]|uniref:2OG-Fe dioxygenase family protein n=1 Tax=Streptomyces triticagri TaxID=2293568 RepID=A0A372M3W9_9ACTN|nr:2OG-Fe dioxygenase family protein [Streptomyces triticagri]RFU85225.1 hypothetical protein DY218_18600 [Streptomyces triticagri]
MTVAPLAREKAALFHDGFAVVRAAEFRDRVSPAGLSSLQEFWENLAPDENLGDGAAEQFRYRRYGRVRARYEDGRASFTPLPHTTFQQSAEHIPIHMGRPRHFEPVAQEDLSHPALTELLRHDLELIATGDDRQEWEIGLHLVRTVAGETPGMPTPEGRHRDGHDYIGMHLLGRRSCTGGESIIYRDGLPDTRLTLRDALDSVVVIDAAVMHEVTPIAASSGQGVRDMLLADFNAVESRP